MTPPDVTCRDCGRDKSEPHAASCRTLIGTDDYDGAPINGGVSDPAGTSGPGLPRYTPTIIASCPECCGDLQDEGSAFWCPACRVPVPFNQVAFFDETDYERD